ncbi:hypothetical protein [Fimbriiglobus ruber]|nr:hypothetical protein [Fimbriiglobus ruber]
MVRVVTPDPMPRSEVVKLWRVLTWGNVGRRNWPTTCLLFCGNMLARRTPPTIRTTEAMTASLEAKIKRMNPEELDSLMQDEIDDQDEIESGTAVDDGA